MLFLPPKTQANLTDLGHGIDAEMARLRKNSDIETTAARQAHYILWCEIIGILDPCGDHPDYEYVGALYMRHLQHSVNLRNKDVL